MKHRWCTALLAALLLLALSACGRRPVLVWEGSGGARLRLYEDGSLCLEGGAGRWVLSGTPDGGEAPLILEFRRQENGLSLHGQADGAVFSFTPAEPAP